MNDRNSKVDKKTIDWLLPGDVLIVYQANRYLSETNETELSILQNRIALEGWGKQ